MFYSGRGVKLKKKKKGLVYYYCYWLGDRKKKGYLQHFEILETLESVARDVSQLISRDSSGKETQRAKVRESKTSSPDIWSPASFQRTRLMGFIKDLVEPPPFFCRCNITITLSLCAGFEVERHVQHTAAVCVPHYGCYGLTALHVILTNTSSSAESKPNRLRWS